MEDLLISPWQNQDSNNLTDLYSRSNKPYNQPPNSLPFKSRFNLTQLNDQSECFLKKKNFNVQIFRKKGHSTSSSLTLQDRKDWSIPSRLGIKLVNYPIQEKQKQITNRRSQKLEAIPKQKLSNQSFEVLQSFYESDLKNIKVLKERTFQKHHTYTESTFKSRFGEKQEDKENQLSYLRKSVQQKHQNRHQKKVCIKRIPVQELKLEIEKKFNITNGKELLRKISFMKKNKLQKYSLSYNNHSQKQLNKTFDVNQIQRLSVNSRVNLNNNIQTKIRHKQRKLSVEKLQNINCFKDNTNVFTTLKKKNKKLFNQLEKYNLFGLRKMKRKSSED